MLQETIAKPVSLLRWLAGLARAMGKVLVNAGFLKWNGVFGIPFPLVDSALRELLGFCPNPG
jgi:hypothetical protein